MTEQALAPRIFIGALELDPSAERILDWFADQGEPGERAYLSKVVSRAILRTRSQVIDARRADVPVVATSDDVPLDTAEEIAAEAVRMCRAVETTGEADR